LSVFRDVLSVVGWALWPNVKQLL